MLQRSRTQLTLTLHVAQYKEINLPYHSRTQPVSAARHTLTSLRWRVREDRTPILNAEKCHLFYYT